jgi:hypothetical protein
LTAVSQSREEKLRWRLSANCGAKRCGRRYLTQLRDNAAGHENHSHNHRHHKESDNHVVKIIINRTIATFMLQKCNNQNMAAEGFANKSGIFSWRYWRSDG